MTAQILICLTMGGLILIQRSEGGALGMGGGPSGFMSARGAGNLLTRATGILAFLFFTVSIALTIVGNIEHKKVSAVDKVDTSSLVQTPVTQTPAPAATQSTSSSAPSLSDLPLASTPTAAPVTQSSPASSSAPAHTLVAPTPLHLPASSTPVSAQKDIEKAKSGIWQSDAAASKTSSSKP